MTTELSITPAEIDRDGGETVAPGMPSATACAFRGALYAGVAAAPHSMREEDEQNVDAFQRKFFFSTITPFPALPASRLSSPLTAERRHGDIIQKRNRCALSFFSSIRSSRAAVFRLVWWRRKPAASRQRFTNRWCFFFFAGAVVVVGVMRYGRKKSLPGLLPPPYFLSWRFAAAVFFFCLFQYATTTE